MFTRLAFPLTKKHVFSDMFHQASSKHMGQGTTHISTVIGPFACHPLQAYISRVITLEADARRSPTHSSVLCICPDQHGDVHESHISQPINGPDSRQDILSLEVLA